MTETLTVARRFCGPPTSGNGGYVSGLVAGLIGGPATVTLKAPRVHWRAHCRPRS